MKAAVFRRYGKSSVLEIADLPAPRPGRGEVLVRVKAAGINPKDAAIRGGVFRPFTGWKFPKLTASDFAGTIEAVGPGVAEYQKGDEVYGYLDGLKGGAAAELLAVRTSKLARKPATLSFEEAAAMPCAYLTALQAYRDYAGLESGARVLVYGASGGVGTAALQVGKCLGCRLTAVSNSRNEAYCRDMGADDFIAYDREPVFNRPAAFDCFFQVYMMGGNRYREARSLLAPGGDFLALRPDLGQLCQMLWTRIAPAPRSHLVIVRARPADLDWLSEQAAAGMIQPHVQEVYPLTEIERAHRQIASKHTRGKLVLRVAK